MKKKQIILSKRLRMLTDMVTPGYRVADIGCDHGFLAIFLVQEGISPHVLAMDVRKGPLAAAAEHVEKSGFGAYIETRLSDGMCGMREGEAESIVCAGMGGRLMEKILTESMDKARNLKELILQPQSELKEFRAFLRKTGFRITDEKAVYEEGKFYFAMKAVYIGENLSGTEKTVTNEQSVLDEYGEQLLNRRDPVLKQYLLFRKNVLAQLLDKLPSENSGRASVRLEEIRQELTEIEWALCRYER